MRSRESGYREWQQYYMMQLMILHRILCSILMYTREVAIPQYYSVHDAINDPSQNIMLHTQQDEIQILFDPGRPVCGHLKNHTKYQRMSLYLTGYSYVEIMNTNCREGRKGILNTASTLYTEGVPGGCRPEAGTHRGPDQSG